MTRIGLKEVYNLFSDQNIAKLIYEDDYAKLVFDEAFIDFDSSTIVLLSQQFGFLRTQVITSVYKYDGEIHNSGWIKCETVRNNQFTVEYKYNNT